MSDIEKAISKARGLEEKATSGDWKFRDGYCYQLNDEYDDALWTANPMHHDARLLESARNTHKLVWDFITADVVLGRAIENAEVGRSGGFNIADLMEAKDAALYALARAVNGGER